MYNKTNFQYSLPESEYEYSREHRDSEGNAYLSDIMRKIFEEYKKTGVLPKNLPLPQPEALTWSKASMLFDIPQDETPIIRYMDYVGFIDLIKNQRLKMNAPQFFTQDCNEGYLYKDLSGYIDNVLEKAYIQIKQQFLNYKKLNFSGLQFDGSYVRDMKKIKARWRSIYNHNRKRFYISCWSNNDIDQDNMWNAYVAGREDAVAIVSNVGALKDAVEARLNYGLYSLTRVQYIDINNMPEMTQEELSKIVTGIWATNCFLLTRKQKNFEDDREIRMIMDSLMCYRTDWYKAGINNMLGQENFDYNAEPKNQYMYSQIDPAILIKKIILSPKASNNRVHEIKTILKNYNLHNIPVENSMINKKLEEDIM